MSAPALEHDPAPLTALATAVRRRRLELGLSQNQVALRGGPSVGTVNAIERSKRSSYRSRTYAELDHALRWESGTAAGLADGSLSDADGRELTSESSPSPGLRGKGRMAGAVIDGVMEPPDFLLPDISGGPEQVWLQLRHLAAQVQLLSAVVAQTRRLVDAQPPGATPDDVRGALTALEYVCAAAQAPLFRASTTSDEKELAERLVDDARRGQASTG